MDEKELNEIRERYEETVNFNGDDHSVELVEQDVPKLVDEVGACKNLIWQQYDETKMLRGKVERLQIECDEWKERAESAEKSRDDWNTDAVTSHIERDAWKEKAEHLLLYHSAMMKVLDPFDRRNVINFVNERRTSE